MGDLQEVEAEGKGTKSAKHIVVFLTGRLCPSFTAGDIVTKS